MSKISDELREFAYLHFSGSKNVGPCDALMGIADRIDAELVELPRDSDGVPIHVGDTVYLDDGRKAKVARIQLRERGHSIGLTVCDDFFALWPEDLTHTRPDSLERIADELEAWCDDSDVDGDACDVPRAIAGRIRRLAAKEN